MRPDLVDPLAREVRAKLSRWLDLTAAHVWTRRVYHLDLDLNEREAKQVLAALVDPVAEVGALGCLPDPKVGGEDPWVVTVGFLPGVTDSVARSVQRVVDDCLGRTTRGRVYTSRQTLLWGLDRDEVERAADGLLYNRLIERVQIERPPRALDLSVPRAGVAEVPPVTTVPLRTASDDELERISREGMLALSLHEMRTIAGYFRDLGRDPTDAELECLAQTWSEHCKHKIFAAAIDYTDPDGARTRIDSLFQTYVRGATEAVARARREAGVDPKGEPFLVSVFHDNAGVVRFTTRDHLVYKVETHNSPSALDPYGGALTGIVGVNRDSFGTGVGADLLANVWGYCFGPPDWSEPLPPGLMAPRRIRDGVHQGVIDGGNESGIPYLRGWELFDPRFLGKPLVFCGTVAAMPVTRAGHPTHEKRTAIGDKVVMVGGRIGKDGIHGATFSSVELDENSPLRAVQLGDPLTQKMMFDALSEACDLGLYSGITDNGAGGLSSSVGEMAELTGGARIDLARAPLKYPGLAPWEILVSEAQERMTLSVPPEHVDAFLELCARREVEATVLGEFTDSGRFEVTHGEQRVVDLPLDFLHDGVPQLELVARWEPPPPAAVEPQAAARFSDDARVGQDLLALLARPGIASHEHYGRRYDHEVKGLSVVKPFVGRWQDVPATATVMRVRHGRPEGVVLGEGVHPFYSDHDTLAMAHACVDEGVRRVLCAGARYDRLAALDNFCWPDPIESDKTPDGPHKLAQLVRCCQGLDQACRAFGVPLISGKDSMKNDANLGGVKISIPPTLLLSVMGQMEDVSRALTLQPLAPGAVLVLLGPTRDERGGSAHARLHGVPGGDVPCTDLAAAAERYQAFVRVRDAGYVQAAHALGRGGLAVALAHMTLAGELGLDVDLAPMDLAPAPALFSESTGRILACVSPEAADDLCASGHGLRLGVVAPARDGAGWLRVRRGAASCFELGSDRLRRAFQTEVRAHG